MRTIQFAIDATSHGGIDFERTLTVSYATVPAQHSTTGKIGGPTWAWGRRRRDAMGYKIEFGGDGEGISYASTWDDVVRQVAEDMKDNPNKSDVDEARDMLENGFDGQDGWDGKRVTLTFEDGWVSVESLAD